MFGLFSLRKAASDGFRFAANWRRVGALIAFPVVFLVLAALFFVAGQALGGIAGTVILIVAVALWGLAHRSRNSRQTRRLLALGGGGRQKSAGLLR